MSSKESKIEVLIREYLLDLGLLRKKINEPKLDFGFQFVFPSGVGPTGKPIGRGFVVTKTKKKDFIEISCIAIISPKHIELLQKEGKKQHFFIELQKYLLSRNFFFHLDAKNNRYSIIDNIFLQKNGTISKNLFFKSVRKIFTSMVYSIVLLNEICENVINLDDWKLK